MIIHARAPFQGQRGPGPHHACNSHPFEFPPPPPASSQEDSEIQDILLREGGDIDAYLLAAGAVPTATGLLPAAAAEAAVLQGERPEGGARGGKRDVIAMLVREVVCFDAWVAPSGCTTHWPARAW